MPDLSRLIIAFKALGELGPARTGWYVLYRLGLLTGWTRRATLRPPSEPPGELHPLFTLPARERLAAVLGRSGRANLLAEADAIATGWVGLFGLGQFPLTFSGTWPQEHWTRFERGAARIPENDFAAFPAADIKFLWEPARFGWAFTLGRAYHLTGEERYAAAFWAYFEAFETANPAYLGPHWMNGQEVALRLMALVWAGQVFAPAAASTAERRTRLAAAVAGHAARIPPSLAYARGQDNNHLLSEAVGLLTAGLALPGHLSAPTWRDVGRRSLRGALNSQIDGYGEYTQHSANYHRLMLQLALWARAVDPQGFPALARRALVRASHWLTAMLDGITGHVPNLGANDGALVLPLASCDFGDHRPVVQAAARAFLQFDLPEGPWDELALWLGLQPVGRPLDPDLYLGEALRARQSWAYLRATQFDSRPGHADLLHFDLWWRGLNVARDAGTYLYNAPPPWDNGLTVARVHNTVTVDGRDQMTRAGRFLYVDWADAFARTLISSDPGVLRQAHGHHNAYRRLGVRHERTVTVFADERWQVRDELRLRRGARRLRLHWLLPDWPWELEQGETGLRLRLRSPHGPLTLSIAPAGGSWQVTLARAGELLQGEGQVLPIDGWVSEHYAARTPALSLAVELNAAADASFVSEFVLPGESA